MSHLDNDGSSEYELGTHFIFRKFHSAIQGSSKKKLSQEEFQGSFLTYNYLILLLISDF